MPVKNKVIHIFSGHYGSGKTETAISLAKKLRRDGQRVVIVDLDTVNPYFRTNDAAKELEKLGIRLVASFFASTNLDMPALPGKAAGVFEGDEDAVIFDVGGDEDGARALGCFNRFFMSMGYSMHYVVNLRRPLTPDAQSLYELAEEIQSASRLRFTDVYNNTNLGPLTDTAVLLSGAGEARLLAEKMGIPLACHCGTKDVVEGLGEENVFVTELTLKKYF